MAEQQGQEPIRAALVGAESDLSYILHRGDLDGWQTLSFNLTKADIGQRLAQVREAQRVLTAALTNHDRLVQALKKIAALPMEQALTRRIEVEAHEIARAALDALKEKP